ncbi:MAG: hypothetical protein ACP5D6_01755, partial [Kosmotogaceae bacterium]
QGNELMRFVYLCDVELEYELIQQINRFLSSKYRTICLSDFSKKQLAKELSKPPVHKLTRPIHCLHL